MVNHWCHKVLKAHLNCLRHVCAGCLWQQQQQEPSNERQGAKDQIGDEHLQNNSRLDSLCASPDGSAINATSQRQSCKVCACKSYAYVP